MKWFTLTALMLLAVPAWAETFDRVPDLAQLVVKPIRGEYFLVCQRYVTPYEATGRVLLTNREVKMATNEVKLVGFPALTLRVMKKNWGLKTDAIATFILVHTCIEDDTTFEILDRRGNRPDRTPGIDLDGKPNTGATLWQQRTRPE